jgi:hypothetical protein
MSARAALKPLQRLATRRVVSQRAYATGEPPAGGFKLADNAFNRDRAAIQAHAKESAGAFVFLDSERSLVFEGPGGDVVVNWY